MARYDLDLVKSAAAGRWVEIISQLGGVDASILDAGHHPCPKRCLAESGPPGGEDRFRVFDDFAQTGGAICNQCFSAKNQDGFATLMWLLGIDFSSAIAKVAGFLGIKSQKKKKANPAEKLDFLPWNQTIVGLWCNSKKPIVADALKRVGARVAKYANQYTVIAIPVWGPALDKEDAVGWVIYRFDGGLLPKYAKKGESVEWVKVKLTAGSTQGLITDLEKWKDTSPRLWIKTEGPTDLLTAESQSWPEGYGFFTTANGAQEKPLDWIVDRLKGQDTCVVHDCDEPGQAGATFIRSDQVDRQRPGWCPVIAKVAKSVKNIVLPFPIEPSHGQDLRDYFGGGAVPEDFLALIADTQPWDIPEEVSDTWVERAEDDPEYLAEINLKKYRAAGRDILKFHGEWYQFKGSRYEPIDKDDLQIRIGESIQDAFDRSWKQGDREKPAKKVSIQLIREVVEATARKSYVSKSVELNSWITSNANKRVSRPGPKNCIALANGILSLDDLFAGRSEDKYLLPHTPEWFSTVCLPYAYSSKERCPTWEKFLEQAFSGNAESIDLLQRWFGYLLIDDMSLEKILFVIGRRRSGKGTIMKTIIELLGRSAVASPSLNSFADQYFLHSMVGKTAAVIPDVRLSRRADNIVITERLLSISGRDPQDIQRKYMSTLNGVPMQVRFTLFSNVLPYLEDHSAAFVSRCIFLSMPNSYYGQEDHTLFERIKAEMPGILNWAIVGRHRLQEDKENGNQPLWQPESGRYLLRQMNLMSAPVSVFLDDRVQIVDDPSYSVSTHSLYEDYLRWCGENDRVKKIDQEAFRRSVRDVYPNLEVRTTAIGTKVESRIYGIAMKESEF